MKTTLIYGNVRLWLPPANPAKTAGAGGYRDDPLSGGVRKSGRGIEHSLRRGYLLSASQTRRTDPAAGFRRSPAIQNRPCGTDRAALHRAVRRAERYLPLEGRMPQDGTGRRREPQQGEGGRPHACNRRKRPDRREIPARTERQEKLLPGNRRIRWNTVSF